MNVLILMLLGEGRSIEDQAGAELCQTQKSLSISFATETSGHNFWPHLPLNLLILMKLSRVRGAENLTVSLRNFFLEIGTQNLMLFVLKRLTACFSSPL